MTKFSNIRIVALLVAFAAAFASVATAQVTTSEIVGTVTDQAGAVVSGATVTAIHGPSGTKYSSVTNSDGRFTLPALRVGGPYTVSITSSGFQEQKREGIEAALGNSITVDFVLGVQEANVEVTVTSDATFNEARTGAALNVSRTTIETMPGFNRSINDFTRLSPLAGSGGTFAGADSRFNNITVDGSYFNNSFGLRNQPGATSGVSPISLDAIEAVQLNIAPYDVRQGNFVGASVNTVTRSGTNDYTGSVYYNWRKPGLVGKEAGDSSVLVGDFDFRLWGFRVGGPVPFFNFGDGAGDKWYTTGKDRLFFFFSFEDEEQSSPAHTFRPRNSTSETAGGNVSRVLASDLQDVSNLLRTNFGYETGPYEGYTFTTPGRKYLGRVDYNINSNNRLNFRYIQLDSSTDNPLSGSSSAGRGRSTGGASTTFFTYENSGYKILENIRSYQGEWTSMISPTMSNSLLVGFTKQDESRGYKSSWFPFVDILDPATATAYISFGFEPFTPNNELRYNTFQLQDNLSFYRGNHTITTGVSFEHYRSENVFFQLAQSVYTYNSLADFKADVNGYLANPNRTTSPVTLNRFQVQWVNIPGLDKPLQPLEVDYWGFYGQDQWKIRDNFSLIFGLRAEIPFFGETGFTNNVANALTFRDDEGAAAQYKTESLPDPAVLWSPRVGFNWSPFKGQWLQVRGGSGVFTGKPAYVWISNQIGNNGLLTGADDRSSTTIRPFNPNTDRYKLPATGLPAATYTLNFTDNDFRFPQIWRTNIGTDVKVPFGLVAGAEYIYSRDLNGMYYINANLPAANTAFAGVDNRPRWTAGNRIHSNIGGAYVLKNQNVGESWNVAFSLEKPYARGFYGKFGYSYGESKNTIDPGSIAGTSYNSNHIASDPNNPAVAFSASSPGHRFVGAASYTIDYFKFGATSIGMFWETRNWGNASYTFTADMNGDGASNDLIYIPKDASEMNFEQFTASSTTFTVAAQQAAFESFIQGDKYLRNHRGQYAERNAAFLPFVTKVDLNVKQEVYFKTAGRKHRFQFNASVLNFANLLNHDWGIGKTFATSVNSGASQILVPRGVDGSGKALYRLRNNGAVLYSSPYINTTGIGDVYRVQLGVRYIFD